MKVGDEIQMPSAFGIQNEEKDKWGRLSRRSIFGVPPGKSHAGIAVAKEQKFWYNGKTGAKTPNPYADWTLSFVVRPGDRVKGKVVPGKIFVNFMETFSGFSATGEKTYDTARGTPSDDARFGFFYLRRHLVEGPNDPAFLSGWDYDQERNSTSFSLGRSEFTLAVPGAKPGTIRSSTDVSFFPMFDEEDYPNFELLLHMDMLGRGMDWLRYLQSSGTANVNSDRPKRERS